jgi:cobalamin biosynthesis protein CobT
MAIARKNIDIEDGFLKGSPDATFAFDHFPSRMIAYGGDETLRALDLTEDDDDDDDEYDEEDEDDEEEDDDDEDEDEGEEIDDEEEEEIEGDDPDQVRIPGSSRVYRTL